MDKKEFDKFVLQLEITLGVMSVALLLLTIWTIAILENDFLEWLLIVVDVSLFVWGICNCLKIEEVVGFYQCEKCKHKYVPTFTQVFWAPHFCRTRWMECPECHKKSWQKKVLE